MTDRLPRKIARLLQWCGAPLAIAVALAGCGGGGGGGSAGSDAPASAQINPVAAFAEAQQSLDAPDGPAPAPSAAANLIPNGGFEDGMAGWTDWGNATVVAGQASSGTSALRVGPAAGGAGQVIAGIVPGNQYRLTAQARVSAASGIAYVGINFLDADGMPFTQNSVLVSSTRYATASLDVVAPANAVSALVYVWKNAGSGVADVDDFALADAGPATPLLVSSRNLVANGGLEGSLANWVDWGNAGTSFAGAASGISAAQVGTGAGGFGQDVGGIVAGRPYRVSALARVSSPGEIGYLGVMFLDDAGRGLLAQNAVFRATAYARVQADVTAPANATRAQVFVWKNSGDGIAFVDDVSFTEVAPRTPLPGAPVALADVNSSARGVAVLGSGLRVAAWSDAAGVHSQLFDAHGGLVGSASTVSASGTFTGVAALAGGGYVIEYSQPDAVLVQVFTASGQVAGPPAVVRTQAQVEADLASHHSPALLGGAGVVALGDGGFAAQYRTTYQATVPGDYPGTVMAQRYDAAGNPVGAPASLAQEIPGFQSASVSSTAGGGLVVAGPYLCPCAAGLSATFGVFDATLGRLGGFSSYPFESTTAQGAAGLGNGSVVGIWTVTSPTSQAGLVKGQVQALGGGGTSTPALAFANAGAGARVTALAGGGFLLSWGTSAQAFDASAQPVGPVLQILDGSIAATPDGGFVVVAQVGAQLVEQQYAAGP